MAAIDSQTREILKGWIRGNQPTADELQLLLVEELSLAQRAKAFGISRENGAEKIEERSRLWHSVYEETTGLCKKLGIEINENTLELLWHLWLPLAIQLAKAREEKGRTLVRGILGGQGTGKSTLAAIARAILNRMGYSVLDLSIDDLYKTYKERQLLQHQDPRLIWRGPPGTHDVELGIELLDRCRQVDRLEPILVPRFDKSAFNGAGDRTKPEKIDRVDLVLFEGWFVGVRPVDERVFDRPLEPIVTREDRLFARDTNERLKEYLPLWERIDGSIVLYPLDYRYCLQWRKEAERKTIAAGGGGMSDAQLDRFVDYFWKSLHPELFVTPLTRNPDVDLVIELALDRRVVNIYRPEPDVIV